MTFGLAPGYCARTTTEGGTTSGYSEIGSARSAIRPASSISSDSTPAKIGRSMKNLDRFMGVFLVNQAGAADPASPVRWRRPLGGAPKALRGGSRFRRGVAQRRHLGLGIHRHFLGRHLDAGPHALQAVDDDALAGLQAVGHRA